MLFNSFSFLLFFPVVCLVYFVLPGRWRQPWLLAASYCFYLCWGWRFALVLAAITLLSWLAGRAIYRVCGAAHRVLMAVGLCGCLAPLLLCKYGGGLLSLVMPVGISFYTFEALGYLFDVYGGTAEPEPRLWRYALFLGFFPTLLSGPIERSDTLLPQLREVHSFDADRVRDGLCLMLWGYFEKLVIADQAAIIVDNVFADYPQYGGTVRLLAVVLYAFQLYADFAGYSHLALGAAQVLGFTLTPNFCQPYLATNFSGFWSRWHISLSHWLQDYIFTPLAWLDLAPLTGGRRQRLPVWVCILGVFLVSGIWHGNTVAFVAWGLLHAAYRIGEEALHRRLGRPSRHPRLWVRAAKRAGVFALWCLSLVFFRAASLRDGVALLHGILAWPDPWSLTDGTLFTLGLSGWQMFVLFCALGVLFAVDLAHEHGRQLRAAVARQPLALRWALYYAAIFAVLVFGVWEPGYNAAAFLYFKF